jgi:NAD(P)-dependent dehydrogenase (short-subunit alcohol dehydrogenase family)
LRPTSRLEPGNLHQPDRHVPVLSGGVAAHDPPGRRSIINVASTVGAHEKGGVTLFTKAMAIDHAKQGVRVNALVPGATDTPMIRKALTPEALEALAASHPIGRLVRPEELANAVLFLASDDASFVTGTAMYVDGGQTAKI